VPADDVYCTDQALSETGAGPALNSAMKSCRQVALEFPPPP